ncbi:conserved hypothetical protein [Rubrivivax sp. A210]|uniref:hypothetical protein n=1 Tax=Rubrivivax sp. A210 TaxID=2772301 RepID=UPI00191AA107|nr:hypothetical protein [Rubrivivax sp. A210]CAD5371942.1 conserved hypothetical protein [Rubrivivax sp. A210]
MDAQALQDMLALAEQAGSVREAAAALRQRHAGLRVVVVDDFDMRDETPAAEGLRHRLFLAATDGHCWSLTTDLTQAAGVFIAARPAP